MDISNDDFKEFRITSLWLMQYFPQGVKGAVLDYGPVGTQGKHLFLCYPLFGYSGSTNGSFPTMKVFLGTKEEWDCILEETRGMPNSFGGLHIFEDSPHVDVTHVNEHDIQDLQSKLMKLTPKECLGALRGMPTYKGHWDFLECMPDKIMSFISDETLLGLAARDMAEGRPAPVPYAYLTGSRDAPAALLHN